jgi:CBS domain-containing protein
VESISPDAAVDDARALMRQRGIHHLVVRRGKAVLGLVSDRDLGGRAATAPAERTVSEVMTTPVVTVDPSAPITRVANLMRGRSIGSVVVSDRGRVTGIVTVSDLLDLLGRGAARAPKRQARAILAKRVPHRKRHAASGVW